MNPDLLRKEMISKENTDVNVGGVYQTMDVEWARSSGIRLGADLAHAIFPEFGTWSTH